jgi:hypothetical protein
MYLLILFLHSWLRWLVVAAALATLWFAFKALRGAAPEPRFARLSALTFTASLDLQILLGLLLYFVLSPYTPNSLMALRASMKVAALRYFAVEHVFVMVLAAIVAHVTAVRARRATSDRQRSKRLLIGVGIALLLILIGIPWPFLPYGRPLLRFG